jgi:hypothetical protein
VQEYRFGRGKVHQKAYFAHAESFDAGKVTLGIVFLRGVLTHHLIKRVGPTSQPLYPSDDLYPSEDLFPGTNFVWTSGAELSKGHTPEPQFKTGEQYYGSHVGGHLMLPTIRQAIDFVITDPVVVTLKYV